MNLAQVMVSRRAPDFRLPGTRGTVDSRCIVGLREFQDRWLVLLFYPRDFSLVCPTELTALSMRLPEFQRRGCDVLAVSTDSLESHERWLRTPPAQGGLGGLAFPLASDVDGAVCEAFGVLAPGQNVALRGLFIIDPNGVLQYQVVHNLTVGRRSDEVLRVLDGLQSGGLCPENWHAADPTLDPTTQLGPGRMLGAFRIEAELGRGTFGVVYRARDTLLERTVAVKLLRSTSSESIQSMLREARLAAALIHPNICTVFQIDQSEGVPLIVMEFVAGERLDRIVDGRTLDAERAVSLARQIASALSTAHHEGIVHGDLKPANVIVTPDGTAKVMDFGLARRVSVPAAAVSTLSVDGQFQPGTLSGTPAYMSPEQARGEELTPASDVFSFGLVLSELLTGQRAVPGRGLLETLHGIEQLDSRRLATSAPPAWRDLLLATLVRDPQRRTITMAEIVNQIDQVLQRHDSA